MYNEVISAQDLDTAARTVYGEARGESFEGKVAVAHSIINRSAVGGWMASYCQIFCVGCSICSRNQDVVKYPRTESSL